MTNLNELLTVTFTDNYLYAKVVYKDGNKLTDISCTKQEVLEFLKGKNVTFGIVNEKIERFVDGISSGSLPLTVAEGYDKQDGKDGRIEYMINTTAEMSRSFTGDFRDVMRLPMVEAGQKIATLISPTAGKNGVTITGKEIVAKQGKPFYMRAGTNVNYDKKSQSFYAKEAGLVNFGAKSLNIYTVHEVNETISMRTGNIDFNGSVVIRGDVPSGFKIKATGDVRVFGLVEAATIQAGGSVYISEGLAGLKKGTIEAKEDVYINYINQGTVIAKRSIHVENSILHSDCRAQHDITCHRGNIIGGTLFASLSIEAKDIGNHMHTPTHLSVGVDNQLHETKEALEKERKQLLDNIQKLYRIQKKMMNPEVVNQSNTNINLKKLTHSYNTMQERLKEVEQFLDNMEVNYESTQLSDIKVFGTIYPNTVTAFGKYRRKIDQNYQQVIVKVEQSDIIIISHAI